MSEREDFEKWQRSEWHDERSNPWFAWQACAALKDKRVAELEAELAEQAKVLVANVDKQLWIEAANKDLQAWFDNVKADYDALKAKLEAMPKARQTYPNHNWCVGCTPETCTTTAALQIQLRQFVQS